MAGPLRPTPLELNGRWNVGKKGKKKVIFSLMAPRPRPLPPPSLNGPSIKRRTFLQLPFIAFLQMGSLTEWLALTLACRRMHLKSNILPRIMFGTLYLFT